MNDLEKIIMEEIASLDEMRLIDVIGFIRYLKAEKPIKQDWLTGWYENALESIHAQEEVHVNPNEPKQDLKKGKGA